MWGRESDDFLGVHVWVNHSIPHVYPCLKKQMMPEISRQNLWCHATPLLEVGSSHVGHVRLGYTSPFQDRENCYILNPFFVKHG